MCPNRMPGADKTRNQVFLVFLARFWSDSGSESRWIPMFTGNIPENMSRLFFVLVSFFTLRMSETVVFSSKMLNYDFKNVKPG